MLRDLLADYARERGIEVSSDCVHLQIGLDTAVPLGLIVNELVTNAIKHAHATHVLVAVERETGGLRMSVTDDGVGGTGSIFLLLDAPEVYGLPPDPRVCTADLMTMYKRAGTAAAGMIAAAAVSFLSARKKGRR